MKNIAKFISIVLHPSIMPMLCVVFVKLFLPYYFPEPLFYFTLIYVSVGTFIFPLIVTLLMVKLQLVSSIFLEKADERKWPFVITAAFYFLTAKALTEYTLPLEIVMFLMAASLSILISFMFLKLFKISAHVTAISGLTTFLILISFKYNINLILVIIAATFCLGLIASSRLYLRAHTPKEIIAGVFTGIIPMLGIFLFL